MASTPCPSDGRERRGHEQDDDEHVLELAEQHGPRRDAAGRAQLVGAVLGQPLRRFCAGQSGRAGIQMREDLISRKDMPGGFWIHIQFLLVK